MNSAEEFFEALNKAANPYWFEGDMPGKDALIDMIRARDREIVGACMDPFLRNLEARQGKE